VTRPRPRFTPLTVAAVDELTDDSVAVTFAVPPRLREAFAFQPGQHLTVRRTGEDGEIRRSYSICSAPSLLPDRGEVRIGVRAVVGGEFSGFATKALRAGDVIEVLPPLGHFGRSLSDHSGHFVAIAAGSGITPVLSLLATALPRGDRFTQLYGNRRAGTVMFAEELSDLKDQYPDRFHLVHVLSREPQLSPLLSGRLDGDRLRAILDSGLVPVDGVAQWYLCGPYGMVIDAQGVLAERGVPDRTVHTELFHVEAEPAPPRTASPSPGTAAEVTVTIRLDGRESTFPMASDERVLDAALRVRGELPYACKGGVCSTCRAKVLEGAVTMAQNYALEPDELAAGYVLTCQSSPTTPHLLVDYDA
jgi:ring-1,2-phenylacetyl-CoA epoxidase subunit PaaE